MISSRKIVNTRCRQFTHSELNVMCIESDFVNHPSPELLRFYVAYMNRKSNNEHDADWSARFPDPDNTCLEVVACQRGVIVTSCLTHFNGEYHVQIPLTCKGHSMDIYTRGAENVFLFLDSFFPKATGS